MDACFTFYAGHLAMYMGTFTFYGTVVCTYRATSDTVVLANTYARIVLLTSLMLFAVCYMCRECRGVSNKIIRSDHGSTTNTNRPIHIRKEPWYWSIWQGMLLKIKGIVEQFHFFDFSISRTSVGVVFSHIDRDQHKIFRVPHGFWNGS